VGISLSIFFYSGIEISFRENLTSDIIVSEENPDFIGWFENKNNTESVSSLKNYDEIYRFLSGIEGIERITPIAVANMSFVNETRVTLKVKAIFIDPLSYYDTFKTIRIIEGSLLSKEKRGMMVTRTMQNKLSNLLGQNTVIPSRMIISDELISPGSMQELELNAIFYSQSETLFENTIFIGSPPFSAEGGHEFIYEKNTAIPEKNHPCTDPETGFDQDILDYQIVIDTTEMKDDFFYNIIDYHTSIEQSVSVYVPWQYILIKILPGKKAEDIAGMIDSYSQKYGRSLFARTWMSASHKYIDLLLIFIIMLSFFILLALTLSISGFICSNSRLLNTLRDPCNDLINGKGVRDRFLHHTFVSSLAKNLLFGGAGIFTGVFLILACNLLPVRLLYGQSPVFLIAFIGMLSRGIGVRLLLILFIIIFLIVYAETVNTIYSFSKIAGKGENNTE
jgi:hypothetical protein